ncbi:cobyrinate a,c-diamide synthase [Maritimibacter sp. DP1N21-5]|uniref:cobyrinate a,c-diamide synthase n=1 Tax=Maritimibacter sp. DP1N21-5 TaxID=2836867 RepID=UPI001C44E01A|nr:cobyrinate a,c-diamide synthase [Maritimibacter sp. DP1N21-5]MBV7409972.1 cobyrinate a,c-diamide synthase [Maritimibacter sp. DP1N21-5]
MTLSATNRGLILAAPASGSGKTTLNLGILRALSRQGAPVRGAKFGPDYIDPRFHEAASGQPSVNLDAWAMTKRQIRSLAHGDGLLIVEGAMGLFDGAPDGDGATADLARILDLPVILVVDAARMSQSVAAVVRGFATHDPEVRVAGVILNRVGSARHEAMLRRALGPLGLPVLGTLYRDAALALPDRHLGLVQAGEHPDIATFLDSAADLVAAGIDLDALVALARPVASVAPGPVQPRPRRIAIARDTAFSFSYPHQRAAWVAEGATLLPFSPLADEAVPDADFVYLPGGYPELHAGRIAANTRFLSSLREAATEADIYGECGGYMVLGEWLTDAAGTRHRMAGLLGLSTSFETRKLHLGYRNLTSHWPGLPGRHKAHEFHYATTISAQGTPLFDATDALGEALDPMGLIEGRVAGSFAHLIP